MSSHQYESQSNAPPDSSSDPPPALSPNPPPRSNFYYIRSHKSVAEVQLFGLRGADIEEVFEEEKEEVLATPEDYGITESLPNGLCKYCQLMLHPSPPKAARHQPNVARLLQSRATCHVCQWLNVALSKGSPALLERFRRGDPALCDPENYSEGVSVTIDVTPRNTTITPIVGVRQGMGVETGQSLSATTLSRLGSVLAARRFWDGEDEEGKERPPGFRLSILKEWLGACEAGHQYCSSLRAGGKRLPTRVLDLTGSLDIPTTAGDIRIRLRETTEGDVGDYVTLSYCWGDETREHLRTTKANLESHKAGMALGVFPLTHREAILATLYMGVRYLWIDSLCIIQDSPQDWQMEAASLASVYAHSFLTLAATSGPHPGYGLLNPLQAPLPVEAHGEKIMVRFETNATIDAMSEPLNRRGWTLQEKFLSPRIVCFGSEQWLWRCAERQATEDGLIDESYLDGVTARTASNQWAIISRLEPNEENRERYFLHWHKLVGDYSRRLLTYRSDKLKAVAGLADAFARRTGYQFAAGLWMEDMPGALLWSAASTGVIRHDDDDDDDGKGAGSIPSWSWASVTGPIMIPSSTSQAWDKSLEITPLLQVTRLEQEWEGVPLSSALQTARLHVRGKMIAAHIGLRSTNLRLRYRLTSTSDPEEVVGEAMLDNAELVEGGLTEIHCLRVLSMRQDTERFVLLLLRGDGGGDGEHVYKRLGIGVLSKYSQFVDRQRRGEGRDMFEDVAEEDFVLE